MDLMEEAERWTAGAPYWGLAWMLISATTWSGWTERNRWLHEGRYTIAKELARRIKEDISIAFQPRRYKKKGTTREERMLQPAQMVA